MNEVEEWKSVPSLPEYLASSLGRIMRAPHQKPLPNGGMRTYGGKPWFGVWHSEEQRFAIRYRGKNHKVARLVCEAFHGLAPFADARVLHVDENSRNNRPDNLKWGTQKENLNAPGFLEYCRSRVGEASPSFKARRSRGVTE
jgi:hypothetical protein